MEDKKNIKILTGDEAAKIRKDNLPEEKVLVMSLDESLLKESKKN